MWSGRSSDRSGPRWWTSCGRVSYFLRSVEAALANEVPLEQLRPLACLHVARAWAREIVDALATATRYTALPLAEAVRDAIVALARELKPSRSRQRIALKLGAVGA